MKNDSAKNLNLTELGAKMPFFQKIRNLIKSECSDGFFPEVNPKHF